MGYRIKVNHSQFDKTAQQIDNYVRNMNTEMSKADSTVTTMLGEWQGNDAQAFKAKWDTVDNSDSVHYKMKKSLENYSNFLRSAGSKYKKAQVDAVNRANRLPRW